MRQAGGFHDEGAFALLHHHRYRCYPVFRIRGGVLLSRGFVCFSQLADETDFCVRNDAALCEPVVHGGEFYTASVCEPLAAVVVLPQPCPNLLLDWVFGFSWVHAPYFTDFPYFVKRGK